jgi:hypothetical protein
MTATTSVPRMIIAVAGETDDDIIWGAVERVQRDMFALGPVAIKLAYFGAEDAGRRRPFISTRWSTDPHDMADLIDHARGHCVCGCFVDIASVIEAAIAETRNSRGSRDHRRPPVLSGSRQRVRLCQAAQRARDQIVYGPAGHPEAGGIQQRVQRPSTADGWCVFRLRSVPVAEPLPWKGPRWLTNLRPDFIPFPAFKLWFALRRVDSTVIELLFSSLPPAHS